MPQKRLDKLITDTGLCSRSQARDRIRAGGVSVDGVVVRDAAAKFDSDIVTVLVDGQPIGGSGHLYVMLHKPDGLLSASRDASKPTVLDLMPPEWRRRGLFCVGRLDKDTTGLLLLTDDGDFAHRVISPKSRIPKIYVADVEGVPTESDVEAFREGIVLKDGLECLPAELRILDRGRVEVMVYEGKYHQVKRMLASRLLPVIALHRRRIGGLELDSALAPGEYRLLTGEELALLGEGLLSK